MLYLKDSLSAKESISILLEVLSNDRVYDQLKEFVDSIPSAVGQINMDTTKEFEASLKNCINEFMKTKTYFWLREDFKNSLYDIEIQINKPIS